MHAREILGTVAALALLVGCGEAADDEPGKTQQAVTSSNGISMNGISMNGISMNGISMNGISMNGISMNGVQLNGTSFSGVLSGRTITGRSFVGTEMRGTNANGATVKLRIDNIESATYPSLAGTRTATLMQSTNADVLLYTISWCASQLCSWKLVGGYMVYTCSCVSWKPICPGTDFFGTTNKAIPFKGRWGVTNPGGKDPNTDGAYVTFACRDSAMAKCGERLGYKPWKSGTIATFQGYGAKSISLDLYHQACVRMIRADYCGDGVAHTVNGNPVDAWDGLGLNDEVASYGFEGEWDEHGSKCLSSARWSWSSRNANGTPAAWFVANSTCPSPDSYGCTTLGGYVARTCPSNVIPPSGSGALYMCGAYDHVYLKTSSSLYPQALLANSSASVSH
jgi:hypothetical protein